MCGETTIVEPMNTKLDFEKQRETILELSRGLLHFVDWLFLTL